MEFFGNTTVAAFGMPEDVAVSSGPLQARLLNTLFSNMQASSSGNSTVELYEYSGHDTTLVAVLAAMSLVPTVREAVFPNGSTSDLLFPRYGQALIFELIETVETGSDASSFSVQLAYG